MTNITHHIMTLISFFNEKHKFYDIHQGDILNQTEVSPVESSQCPESDDIRVKNFYFL